MQAREEEIKKMEDMETELLKRLQNTQQQEKTAFQDLEKAMKEASESSQKRIHGGNTSRNSKFGSSLRSKGKDPMMTSAYLGEKKQGSSSRSKSVRKIKAKQ